MRQRKRIHIPLVLVLLALLAGCAGGQARSGNPESPGGEEMHDEQLVEDAILALFDAIQSGETQAAESFLDEVPKGFAAAVDPPDAAGTVLRKSMTCEVQAVAVDGDTATATVVLQYMDVNGLSGQSVSYIMEYYSGDNPPPEDIGELLLELYAREEIAARHTLADTRNCTLLRVDGSWKLAADSFPEWSNGDAMGRP